MKRPRCSLGRGASTRTAITSAALAGLLVVAGCGKGASVAENATVTAYVAAPLCAEAEGEAAKAGDRAGELRVRVVCLPAVERDGRLDLAQIGANARRAIQDSSAVGYIGEATRAATRFSETILVEAEVAQLSGPNGAAAMDQLLEAIDGAPSGTNPRQPVYESLG